MRGSDEEGPSREFDPFRNGAPWSRYNYMDTEGRDRLPWASMSTAKRSKRAALAAAGLVNPRPNDVLAPLFLEHPEFFDATDLVQVRYEALRARLVDGEDVTRLCEEFGVSRQTFYNLLEKFTSAGLAGLLPGKRGPREAWKLGPEIRAYLAGELDEETPVSGATLASRIEARFGLSVHKRTVERLMAELRSKKKAR